MPLIDKKRLPSPPMFQLENAIVSSDIFTKDFVCNLKSCRGICCVKGHAGAPLEREELQTMKEVYPKVKPLLRKEGIASIEQQGLYTTNKENGYETTLVQGKECAYVIFDKNNTALCAIEQAYNAGIISWQKPISCHLYPIRLQEYTNFIAVNYQHWEICDKACVLGKELQIPVYKFVKQALVRKFGKKWYEQLENIAKGYLNKEKPIDED